MFRQPLRVWLSGLILVLLAAGCAPAAAAPVQEDRLGNLEKKVETLSQLQLDLTSLRFKVNQLSGDQTETADLQTRLDDLQTRLDALAAEIEAIPSTGPATGPSVDPFNIALAQYVMDSAGFHYMAEALNETKVIDPAYLESINRVQKVFANTRLPAELSEQGRAFTVVLNDLAAALATEKGEEAAELANKVHGAQHGFTKAVDEWLLNAAGNSQ